MALISSSLRYKEQEASFTSWFFLTAQWYGVGTILVATYRCYTFTRKSSALPLETPSGNLEDLLCERTSLKNECLHAPLPVWCERGGEQHPLLPDSSPNLGLPILGNGLGLCFAASPLLDQSRRGREQQSLLLSLFPKLGTASWMAGL